MRSTIIKLRAFQALVVATVALLAGCQSLPEKLEADLKEAKALVGKCAAIDQAFTMPDPSQMGPQLKARLRLKLTGVACKVQDGGVAPDTCSDGDPNLDLDPVTAALEAFISQLQKLSDDARSQGLGLQADIDAIKASRDEIRKQVSAVLTAVGKLQPDNDAIAKACATPGLPCGRAIATSLTGLAAELGKQKAPFAKIAGAIAGLRAAVESIDQKLAKAGGKVGADLKATAEGLRDLARRAEAVFGQGAYMAGLILSADVQATFDELYVHRLKYRSADRFITFAENEMAKFDKLVDKADDKLLMGGSFALWFWEDRIQRVFDNIVESMAKEALEKLDFTLAFGRAGCDHLEKTPPPPAMFAPFLNRAIVKMASESLCADPSGTVNTECAKERLAEMADPATKCPDGKCTFEQKVASERRKSPLVMTEMMRFQTCQVGKVMAVAGSLAAGAAEGQADAAARACGGVVENFERQFSPQRRGGAPGYGTYGLVKDDGVKPASPLAGLTSGELIQMLRSQAAYQPVASPPVNVTVLPPTVVIPPAPPAPSPPAATKPTACQQLEQRLPGARCSELKEGSIELAFQGLYREGEFQSENAYASMVRLADAVRGLDGRFAVIVGGTASSSRLTCASIVSRLERAKVFRRDAPNIDRPLRVDPIDAAAGTYAVRVPKLPSQEPINAACGKDARPNAFLAVLRAATAADLLARGRAQAFESIGIANSEAGAPAPFVAALDRGLVVTLTRK